jgi:hypothetical protein
MKRSKEEDQILEHTKSISEVLDNVQQGIISRTDIIRNMIPSTAIDLFFTPSSSIFLFSFYFF